MKELEKEIMNYFPKIPDYKPAVIGEEKPQPGYAEKINFPDAEPKVIGDLKPQLGYEEKKVVEPKKVYMQ